uniref:spermatogenesis associated 2-like n=1 Tax=Scatophagus argus TaxID=75038 RepID=UPI001ED7F6B2|nr:spermatogenesis associated 2-like [Scatophagus argus]XP_046250774.1 spermatogenesis associated 2-like [Scatophagus argus]XP_046250775.1 spermatogenesis associated 2-like [Scatophagus argus]XP_046250777.1 spermatogenesis associated 2-like [Scatophagus argus]XP_046250778.1 spermatogenesis associated 2-like [Scatophagus argus]XP_046250779.1 spermatogenesis associated 2-like [Scatophagus argus]XP_046250780.1 spermatogenesis associated 2-like [Scatophagus argus]XP_046250781.1 spermatogenesis a
MKEMSISRQRATDLVTAYGHSLEQQIVGQGSSLACRDEELWNQVEELLRDEDAQETHCLGLDPLRVMEESLKEAAATRTACAGRVKAGGGLQGLAKAFEVVEQAALNLYLGPWREEYKVVKMYSGTFTHYIKPVLSMPQIEKLFGLLGYQSSSSRHEELRFQSTRVSSASLDDLLRLSCAFFLARCECHLLLTALGKHAGEAQWELSVVKERQRGNSVQAALDSTKKKLEVNRPPFDGDVDMDLYTDEEVKGGQSGMVISDDKSPHRLSWVIQSSVPPLAVKTQSNGVTSLSSSCASPPLRENVRISTLKCQLTDTSPQESDTARSSSASMKQVRRACEEQTLYKVGSQSHSLQEEEMGLYKCFTEVNRYCSCLQASPICLQHCTECNTVHSITCALLQHCYQKNHDVVTPESTKEEAKESREGSPQGGMITSATLTSSSAAMSSLASYITSVDPIAYHECCDLAQLDPQLLCFSCSVFHSGSCKRIDVCQSQHNIKPLGVCSCGKMCSRKPLVLCRYCGNEFCTDCWYRSPVVCSCGQTFDQSSPV